MNALEIAASGDVPDDDGFAFRGGVRSAMTVAVTEGVRRLGNPAVELRQIDHTPLTDVSRAKLALQKLSIHSRVLRISETDERVKSGFEFCSKTRQDKSCT